MSTAIIDAKLYASFFLISLDEKPLWLENSRKMSEKEFKMHLKDKVSSS